MGGFRTCWEHAGQFQLPPEKFYNAFLEIIRRAFNVMQNEEGRAEYNEGVMERDWYAGGMPVCRVNAVSDLLDFNPHKHQMSEIRLPANPLVFEFPEMDCYAQDIVGERHPLRAALAAVNTEIPPEGMTEEKDVLAVYFDFGETRDGPIHVYRRLPMEGNIAEAFEALPVHLSSYNIGWYTEPDMLQQALKVICAILCGERAAKIDENLWEVG